MKNASSPSAGILLTIVVFRVNERIYAAIAEAGWFPGDFTDPQPMWAVYVTWGLICLLVGWSMWRRRGNLPQPSADG